MQVDLHAYSFGERSDVVETLSQAVDSCGGFMLDRRLVAEDTAELQIELRLRSVIEFYAMVQSQGLELTRNAHRALTELCTVRQRLGGLPGRVVALRLELRFLEQQSLHSLLATGCDLA